MNITQAEALSIVSLDSMKTELRIPLTEAEHDALITEHIHSAANYVATATAVALADLIPLRASIIAFARSLYDGNRELSPTASGFGWMSVYRSYKVAE